MGIFCFHGTTGGTARFHYYFAGTAAAGTFFLYCGNYRKYAAGAGDLSVARKVLVWGADKPVIGKFFSWCLEKGEKGGKKLQEKAGRGLFIALLLFVGIPLPGTGAWTGTLAASILDMDFKSTIIAVMLGVLLAGIIMMVLSVAGFGMFLK